MARTGRNPGFRCGVADDRRASPTVSATERLLRLPEFRALWISRALSLVGDQLARVALAVLVFDRTRSPGWTGLVYALTFLPSLAAPVFAGIADRRPRRSVMVALDAGRAVTVGCMALPGVPLVVIVALLVCATAVGPVYEAARSAALRDVLPAERYPGGLAVMSMTYSAALIAGFGCGGLLVALVGARSSLGIDAATFAASALLIRSGVRSRDDVISPSEDVVRGRHAALATIRLVFTSPLVRPLVAVAWLSALWMTPEALAAPYAAALGRGHSAVGLLMAAMPAGTVVGGFLVARFLPPAKRWAALTPMGMLSSAALAACVLHPSLWLTCTLWTVCGLGTSYNLAANAAFVEVIPNASRSQAFALVATGMVTGEGLAALVAGAASSVLAPSTVIGVAGLLGLVAFTALRSTWLRPRPAAPDLVAIPAQPGSRPAVQGSVAS